MTAPTLQALLQDGALAGEPTSASPGIWWVWSRWTHTPSPSTPCSPGG